VPLHECPKPVSDISPFQPGTDVPKNFSVQMSENFFGHSPSSNFARLR
jgi:hypothetical protein